MVSARDMDRCQVGSVTDRQPTKRSIKESGDVPVKRWECIFPQIGDLLGPAGLPVCVLQPETIHLLECFLSGPELRKELQSLLLKSSPKSRGGSLVLSYLGKLSQHGVVGIWHGREWAQLTEPMC